MHKHLELLPPKQRSLAMGRLRREGFTISPSSTASRLAMVTATAMGVPCPKGITDGARLIKQYLSKPETATGYGEVKNWVVYVPDAAMNRAIARAANPYERLPGDGR